MALPPTPDGVELKPSAIHGIGAFATQSFLAEQRIGDYVGIKMLKSEFRRQYGSDIQYVYWTRMNYPNSYVWVAKGEHRNFITYINESNTPNVYLKSRVLYASKNIRVGDELFLKYDAKYPRDYEL